MSSDFSTGLMISVVGLLVTFTALGVFIGVIYLLKAIFPYKPEPEEEGEGEAAEGEAVEAEAQALTESDDEEIAAAIAAVSYLKSHTARPAAAQFAEPAAVPVNVPGKNTFWDSL